MKSEMEQMLEEQPWWATTKTRTIAAIRRKTDNVEEIVKKIADSIDKNAQAVERIDKNTEDMPWLSRFVANFFKATATEAEKKYPSRRK